MSKRERLARVHLLALHGCGKDFTDLSVFPLQSTVVDLPFSAAVVICRALNASHSRALHAVYYRLRR